MAQVIGVSQAKTIGDNHENCAENQPAGEMTMDKHNNAMGRAVPKGSDCTTYCLKLLEDGKLMTEPPKGP